jgi:hypothetical protein
MKKAEEGEGSIRLRKTKAEEGEIRDKKRQRTEHAEEEKA